jgi:dihydrofolate synthase/folylpolyglutamate synthase
MSYSAAVESLYSLAGELHVTPGQSPRKFKLEDVRVLAAGLGNPERKFHSVLIAGTNGKGSTAATLASILTSAGYRTGLYTSPHLSRVNERVQINGRPISDDDFAAYYFRVDDTARKLVTDGALVNPPSFFETMTGLALLAFADQKVDIAVLEVGMGGRLDATNIVEPLVSVITDISLDHTEWLGNTITAIAREKAGILRRDGVLVTLSQHPEANQVIGEVASELNVRGVNAAAFIPAHGAQISAQTRYPISVRGEQIEVASPLAGVHQQRNLALAIATADELCNHHGYNISAANIAEGIRRTVWPGRLERFSHPGQADVLIDVAHNPAGTWALRSALSSLDPAPQSITAVFGCLKDKAFGEMAQILFPLFDRVILTPVDSPRSATMEELRAAASLTHTDAIEAESPVAALKMARGVTPADGLVVVTGSVYLIGTLRPLLLDPPDGAQ